MIAKPACHLDNNFAQVGLALLGNKWMLSSSEFRAQQKFPVSFHSEDRRFHQFYVLAAQLFHFCRTLLTALC